MSAGNPVLSVPDGDALVEAMGELELCVSLDFYVNETNRHADYILPSPTFYERDDLPLAFLGFYTTPFIQYTDAVVPPAGESREEWEVIDEIAKRIGIVPFSVKARPHASAACPGCARIRAASPSCCCASGPRATSSGSGAAA